MVIIHVFLFGCAVEPAWAVSGQRPFHETLAAARTKSSTTGSSHPVELGLNTNKHLCFLQREFLDRSHTTWVRGFVPASEFLAGTRNVRNDKPLAMLKAVADSGRKVILAIKWDLDRANWRVPEPGSPAENKWLIWVDDLVDSMAGRLAILSVTNEMYADTLKEDLKRAEGGTIPYLRFQQRLVSHIRSRNPVAAGGGPLPIYVGGVHAMHLPERQQLPVTLATLQWAANSKEVTGVDLHLHIRDTSEMEEGLRFTRANVKDKPIIVTEFSPVWRNREKLGEALGVDEAGRKFAQRYGLDPGMRVLDYLNRAMDQPVSEQQWQAFLTSRSWFDPLFISKAVAIMGKYGVSVATYDIAGGLTEGQGRPFTMKTNPWIIHMLFVNTLAKRTEPDGRSPVNYGVFADYLRLQEPSSAECSRRSTCPWQTASGKELSPGAFGPRQGCTF